MITFPSNIATNILGNISNQIGDIGTLGFLVTIGGIGLAFFIIENLIAIFMIERDPLSKKIKREIARTDRLLGNNRYNK